MSEPARRASWLALAAQAAVLGAVAFALAFWMQAGHLRGLVRPDIPGLPQPEMRDLLRAGLMDLAVRTAVRALLTGAVLAGLVVLARRRWRGRAMAVWAAATIVVLGIMALTL